jgi:PDZ domain
VVQAPENDAFKLEDGDVLQAIDGRKPEDGGHALRILRSYKSGEKLNLTVLRQRKPVTLAVTMPERPEMGDNFMFESLMPGMPPMPAMPLSPPSPPGPGTPGSGAGTLE